MKKCKEEENEGHSYSFRNNMSENITKIESIIYLQYALQSFKLIFIIMNAAYVTGMLWIITCNIHKEFYISAEQENMLDRDPSLNSRYFLKDFGIQGKSE